LPDLEKPRTAIARSRRNLIKAGVIGASAAFAYLTANNPAAASFGVHNNFFNNNQGDNNNNNQGGGNGKCFLKGTMIRTADGDRKVVDLAVGDLLPTVFGGICPIQWIGCYPYGKGNQVEPRAKDVLPVRVARSALGPNVPHADLYVTKAHALLIDGVLVTAGSLINGTTISLDDSSEHNELEFFHIKLARHNVIYAEGAPCETVRNFDESAVNFNEYLRHYGPPVAQEASCATLLSLDGRRSEIKSRFRSAISPWMDRRQRVDIIRDELEERGIALLRQSEHRL
jgi:hypothetical protein